MQEPLNKDNKSTESAIQQLDFLYFSIKDTQDNIRFVDNKTAFIITFLMAYVITFFGHLNDIIIKSNQFNCFFWLFFYLFIIFWILSAFITYNIIKPLHNPTENIDLTESESPSLESYLSKNYYKNTFLSIFFNSIHNKLEHSYKQYTENINNANSNDIIKALVFELQKISFIRNLKHKRLKTLYIFFIFTSIFLILIIILKYFTFIKII